MNNIKILPPEIVAKIAAGEVIERPAQIVKELVENAIDARSTEITVEITEGGRGLIKAIDNGIGIRPEELPLAFNRHATSKIASLNDLDHITTLGFRGEALASIASCSLLEIVSKAEEGPAGQLMKIEGGKVMNNTMASRTRGTTVIIENLFFNLPARKKFLKSIAAETAHIVGMFSQITLAHPQIRFRLKLEGRVNFDLLAGKSFRNRVQELYGLEMEGLKELKGEKAGIRLSGGVMPPTFFRSNRDLQIFIVNRRPVRSPLLSHALQAAFQSLIPSGKFPAGFILLEVPPEELDVNVHPTKREVKFSQEKDVHSLVFAGLRLGLQNINTEAEIKNSPIFVREEKAGHYSASETASITSEVREEVEAYLDEMMGPIDLLGQVKDTYLIREKKEGLELIDQHAAQERLIYERLKNNLQQGRIERQTLLFPLSIEPGLKEAIFLKERLAWLEGLGLEVEEFGSNTFLVRTIPAGVKEEKAKEFILGLLEELAGLNEQDKKIDLKESAFKIMACRSSLMAGDKIGPEERMRLLKELEKSPQNMTCPHGRPIRIVIPWEEIEKRFKR